MSPIFCACPPVDGPGSANPESAWAAALYLSSSLSETRSPISAIRRGVVAGRRVQQQRVPLRVLQAHADLGRELWPIADRLVIVALKELADDLGACSEVRVVCTKVLQHVGPHVVDQLCARQATCPARRVTEDVTPGDAVHPT